MARRKSPKETSITRSILDDLRLRGPKVWFRKNHGGPFGTTGVPDIEVVFEARERDVDGWAFQIAYEMGGGNVSGSDPGGYWRASIAKFLRSRLGPPVVSAWVEVKKPGKEPTELQRATIAAIRRAGGFVTVATTKREAIEFLESLGLPPKMEKPE